MKKEIMQELKQPKKKIIIEIEKNECPCGDTECEGECDSASELEDGIDEDEFDDEEEEPMLNENDEKIGNLLDYIKKGIVRYITGNQR